MNEFAYPWVLVGLILVPIAAIMMFAPPLRKRRLGTFVFSATSVLAAHKKGWKTWAEPVLEALPLLALALMIIALARPQTIVPEQVEVEGIDIYLALDMSGSMRAIDLDRKELGDLQRLGQNPLNRFESAVKVLRGFIQTRRWDRIGMVVFARDAFLQFPLTLDRNTVLSMLDRLKLGDIEEGGTAIGNALGRAVSGLKDSEAKTKIVILITDGDRRGGNISPKQATEMARKYNIKVYPILVGRAGVVLVPSRQRDFLTNRIVYSETEFPVDPELLEKIAEDTGGRYYRATDQRGLEEDLHEILDEFEKTRMKDATNIDPNENFRPWVMWALAILLFQFLLRHTFFRKFP